MKKEADTAISKIDFRKKKQNNKNNKTLGTKSKEII